MLKRGLILVLGLALAAPALGGGYYGARYHYGGHFQGHHGGSGDALLAGLVIGGLIGYFINEDRHYSRRAYASYYDDGPYYYGGYRPYRYPQPAYRKYVRVTPPPRVIVREYAEFAGQNCRMTREYTTTVEIDGERLEAYGTRCLTADGSWVLGKPKLVPDFD